MGLIVDLMGAFSPRSDEIERMDLSLHQAESKDRIQNIPFASDIHAPTNHGRIRCLLEGLIVH